MPFIHVLLLVQATVTLAHVPAALREPHAAYGMLSGGEVHQRCKRVTQMHLHYFRKIPTKQD